MAQNSHAQHVSDALTRHQLSDMRSNVMLVICAQDSMKYTLDKGMLQALIERVVALSARLNPGAPVTVLAYAEQQKTCPPLTAANAADYLAQLTAKTPKKKSLFGAVADFFAGEGMVEGLGNNNNAKPVLDQLCKQFAAAQPAHNEPGNKPPIPTLVIFINDGSLCEAEGIFDTMTDVVWSLPAFFYFAHFETTSENIGLSSFFTGMETLHEGTACNARLGFVGEMFGVPLQTARLEHQHDESKVDNQKFYDSILEPFSKWWRNAEERLRTAIQA